MILAGKEAKLYEYKMWKDYMRLMIALRNDLIYHDSNFSIHQENVKIYSFFSSKCNGTD